MKLVGPSMKGLWERTEKTSAGDVKVDADYITESIWQPQAKIVEGYPPAMPPFQGQLKQEQVNAIIEYIKTLK